MHPWLVEAKSHLGMSWFRVDPLLLREPITALTDSLAPVVDPVPPLSSPCEHPLVYTVRRGALRTSEPPPPTASISLLVALWARLDSSHRQIFHLPWEAVPCHLRKATIDVHYPEWIPTVIDDLGALICGFLVVFSTSKTDLGACSVQVFEMSLPPDTMPVTLRPYRDNPIVAEEGDAILDQYWAAGLIQHSTSPNASLLVVLPKTMDGIRITVKYKKLNKASVLGQLSTSRVDEVFYSFGKVPIILLFNLVFSFHQDTVYEKVIVLTAFHTSTQLSEWLISPRRSRDTQRWIVPVINAGI